MCQVIFTNAFKLEINNISRKPTTVTAMQTNCTKLSVILETRLMDNSDTVKHM